MPGLRSSDLRKVEPTLPIAALAALVVAGCGGTGGAFSGGSALPPAVDSSGRHAADHSADNDALHGNRSSAGSSAEARGALAESARPASADLLSTGTAATRGTRSENARNAAVAHELPRRTNDKLAPSAARVGMGASPSAPEATANGVAVAGTRASGARWPKTPSATPAARAETGGVGVWLLGLLLAAAVGGGGWLALQPEWVRKRVLRSIKAAPGRLLTMLRLRRAHGNTITTTWSTPGSAWIASACEDEDRGARAEGMGSRRKSSRRRSGLTNLTLPVMRIPVDKESDNTTTDGD